MREIFRWDKAERGAVRLSGKPYNTLKHAMKILGPFRQIATPVSEGGVVVIPEGGIAVDPSGWIRWVGPFADRPDGEVVPPLGEAVIPGFVDPHTHLVYPADRFDEFLLRQEGHTYEEILKAGGGILSTVRKLRETPLEALVESAARRTREMLTYGTTTVEIKTGYGLSLQAEAKMLQAIEALARSIPQRVVPTFLGAHAFPREKSRQAYLREILEDMLPAFQGRAVFCDVFADRGVFSVEEAREILIRAKALGYKLKLHADELAYTGASLLAAELGAVSADHLDRTPREVFPHLAKKGVTVVLLPTVSLFLKGDFADYAGMREAGVRVALATDLNPGSSPYYSMQTVMREAVRAYGMSLEEALVAATWHAAWALDLQEEVGRIAPGYRADLVELDRPDWRYFFYEPDRNPVIAVWIGGERVYVRPPA